MAIIGWIVVFLFALVAALFVVFNNHSVTLTVIQGSVAYDVPLWVVGLAPFFFGALVGFLAGWISGGPARRRAREQRRRAEQLQRQLKVAEREAAAPAGSPSSLPPTLSQVPASGQLAGPAR